MQINRDEILRFVQKNGPLLPVELARELDTEILFASAILSELVDNGKLFLSNAKLGGSPLYYTSNQESKLQVLRDKLGDMEQKAFDFLKEKIVVEESTLEPSMRVAIKEIKDFSRRIEVNRDGNLTYYWKWYLSSNDDVQKVLNNQLTIDKPVTKKEPTIPKEPESASKQPEPAPKPIEQNTIKKPILKQQTQDIIKDQPPQTEPITDSFEDRVITYLKENSISVIKRDVIKKNKEFNFLVEVTTAFGPMKMFLKAKDKKRINDADLALLRAPYPLVFLTSGVLTKNAEVFRKEHYVMVATV